jgi:hypothetical protein
MGLAQREEATTEDIVDAVNRVIASCKEKGFDKSLTPEEAAQPCKCSGSCDSCASCQSAQN